MPGTLIILTIIWTIFVCSMQQEDLTALGKVILALACRSLMAVQRENMQTSLDLVARTYSSDLRNVIMYVAIYMLYRDGIC
jgi:hypothetical protein